MKALTFKELKVRINGVNDRAKERHEKIRAEEKALAALRKEQDAAAEAGNFDLYDELDEKIRKAENHITVLLKYRDPEIVNPEMLQESWREHGTGRERAIARCNEGYEKARADAAAKFEAMLDEQNQLLQERAEYARLAGLDPHRDTDAETIEKMFPLSGLIERQFDSNFPRNFPFVPEYSYFGRSGIWSRNALEPLNMIIMQHKPVDDLKLK